MPGLAQALPTVSNGGKTYTFMLRPGLHYSNGTPIKASDVTYALERDIKIPWQAASFVSAYIAGGTAYANGKAKTISGITTDDATGKIVVNLVAPFAPIEDIFALAGTAPVPPSTPMKNLANTGTIGDGPYMWGPITPNQTYTLVQNPKFDVPGLARGHADKIVFQVNSNVTANAEAGAQQPGRRVRPRRHAARVPPAAGADAGERTGTRRSRRTRPTTSGSASTRSRSTTCTPARRCWPRSTTGPCPGWTAASCSRTAT